MKGYIFPGQASQFAGMGKDLYEEFELARDLFEMANDLLNYRISDVMFEGSASDLKQTKVTQPAVFIYSYLKARLLGDLFQPEGVAGHSLGEFTALVASGCLTFKDGLKLVKERADAMQQACEMSDSTMAAIVGLEDVVIEKICKDIDGNVIAANYNCPGQLVISGETTAVEEAVKQIEEAGARRAILLAVGGAFHSTLMEPAQERLSNAIDDMTFNVPVCPVYQNVDAQASTDPEVIKQKLKDQLTSPVLWSQTMQHMMADGFNHFTECGSRVLTGFLRRINRKIEAEAYN
jgi:[acyl-carrier-protein] S-malonyltransferase